MIERELEHLSEHSSEVVAVRPLNLSDHLVVSLIVHEVSSFFVTVVLHVSKFVAIIALYVSSVLSIRGGATRLSSIVSVSVSTVRALSEVSTSPVSAVRPVVSRTSVVVSRAVSPSAV